MIVESGFADDVLADLSRLGLISVEPGVEGDRVRLLEPDLRLFLKLLSSFSPRLVPMTRPGCPVHFCTGLLKSSEPDAKEVPAAGAPIPAGGQGDIVSIAAISCIGELSERLTLCSIGISDNRIFNYDKKQPQVDFGRLLGLSEAQASVALGRLRLGWDLSRVNSSDWSSLSDRRVRLRNLQTHEEAQCLSLGILFNEADDVTGLRLPFASSVGCAVWHDLEGARARALLELVERDAVAQAWYNRLGITSLPEGYVREMLPPDLVQYLDDQPREWELLHVDTDLPVQVVICVSHDGYGRGSAFGSSAGWDTAQACTSAIQEMLQSENALSLMDKSYPASHGAKEALRSLPRQLAYARERVIFEDLPLQGAVATRLEVLEKTSTFESLLQGCFDREISLWEFDATRQDLAIPCIKLLSPELCSWEPRFGKKRLFDGVVERGLRDIPASEAEFSARPFPF